MIKKEDNNLRKPFTGEREQAELKENVVQIDRVTRTVAGGRRFKFRATVVVGDEAGHVGIGVAKGGEVTTAIQKAISKAKKHIISVPRAGTTIPFIIEFQFGGASILLKPASEGTGVIAGGPVRAVLELAGIKDVLSKILGSSNKINNVKATFMALQRLKELAEINSREDKKE